MKKLLLTSLVLFVGIALFAQSDRQVKWAYTAKKIADKTYEVHLSATIGGNWHMYAQNVGVEGPLPTVFTFTKNPLLVLDGTPKEKGKVIKKKEEVWGGIVNYYEKSVDFIQTVKVKGTAKTNLSGKVEFMVCDDKECLPPAEVEFSVAIGG
ncbi:MAG: protein-disulfide reductase DsbD family protein [Chitinophagaceae bacterium]